jgi:PAS domain S-box-containing protein
MTDIPTEEASFMKILKTSSFKFFGIWFILNVPLLIIVGLLKKQLFPGYPIWADSLLLSFLILLTGISSYCIFLKHAIVRSGIKDSALKEKSLRKLNSLISEMVLIPDFIGTYKYITSSLRNLYPHTIVLYVSIDEKNNKGRLESISGINQFLLRKVAEITGFDPVGKEYTATKENEEVYRKGTFVEIKGGLKNFAAFDSRVNLLLEKIINLRRIYVIGVNKDQNILGTVIFLVRKDRSINDNNFIEAFARHSAVIIQRKLFEEDLIRSEEKYRGIIEKLIDVFYRTDKEGFITLASPSCLKVFGYTSMDEVIGKHLLMVYKDPAEGERFLSLLKERGEVINHPVTVMKKDGSEIFMEATVRILLDDDGNYNGIEGITRDITDRIKIERSLVESEKKFRQAFDFASIGIAIISIEGKWLKINKSVSDILGYTQEDLADKTFVDITFAEDIQSSLESVGRLLKGEMETFKIEKRYVHKNDSLVWSITSVSLICDDKGNPMYFIAQIVDQTKQKLTDEKVRSREDQLVKLNDTKDRLISIIAHDLKSPLSGIVGISEMMLDNHLKYDTGKSELFLRQMNSSLSNTLSLLDNLLIWAKAQTGQIAFTPRRILLNLVVEETFRLFESVAHHKKISMTFSGPYNTVVYSDEEMLKSILRNLISNAIKFSSQGGEINVSAFSDNEKTEIRIADKGIGMDAGMLNSLFQSEPVSTMGTANEKGTGLGLVICREFIDRHSGKILIESEEGKGSCFIFTLPFSDNQ